MGIYSVTMKTHSRENITHLFAGLNVCKIHNCKPEIFKMVVGKKKETYYVANCVDDGCGKITSVQNLIGDIWNNYNKP